MSGYFDRARLAIRNLLAGGSAPAAASPVQSEPLDDQLAIADGRVTFLDPDRAAVDPSAWLSLFEASVERNTPIAAAAAELIRAQTTQFSGETMLWGPTNRARFLALLRPRRGLSQALAEMRENGLLGVLMPEFYRADAETHSLAAVANLEGIVGQADLSGARFGTMVRELDAPELIVLALLLHHPPNTKEHNPAKALALAQTVLDRLHIEGETRRVIEFLIEDQLLMAQAAFRQDTSEPIVTSSVAETVTRAAQLNSTSTEDHLKMLSVLTVSDIGASGRESLSSWKAELVWRLFVDTYNRLTMAYGDEVIDTGAAARTALHANRPTDISEAELVAFLEGLPQRYLTLFDADTVYQHVRLRRNIGPDDVHAFLAKKDAAWSLTVVTLDKPNLFANVCGALAILRADILRGQALTSRNGLVLDVFEFVSDARPFDETEFTSLLADVIAGRVDLAARLAHEHPTDRSRTPASPLIYFDNDYSHRYTVLEVVAEDRPGLLYRMSRAISAFQCVVDLVLISTESEKAIDVFHLTKDGAKLADSDQMALTEQLERALGDSA
jgi:[protein-PII] uridylyltransferase